MSETYTFLTEDPDRMNALEADLTTAVQRACTDIGVTFTDMTFSADRATVYVDDVDGRPPSLTQALKAKAQNHYHHAVLNGVKTTSYRWWHARYTGEEAAP